MSLSTTTSTTASWASAAATAARVASTAASTASGRRERVPGHVTTAAETLGLDVGDVMSSLQSGKSLFDLADAQGVSRSDLVAALKAGAPQELRESADAVVEALASTGGVGGPGGTGGVGGGRSAGTHQGPPPPPSGTTGVLSGSLTSTQQSTLSSLSDLLGTDAGSLLGQLQSGTDLTDLLSAKGVTLDQLSSTLEEGLLVDTRV